MKTQNIKNVEDLVSEASVARAPQESEELIRLHRENIAFLLTNLSGEIASFQDCLGMDYPDGFKHAIAELINHVALLRGHCLNWLEDHDCLTVNL